MRALKTLGYSRVRDYKGGKKEWMETGLPLETAKPAGLFDRLREALRL